MKNSILNLLACLFLLVSGTGESAEKTTYFFNDIVGSPVQAYDHNGTKVWSESYTPYGEKREKPAENKNDVGFTGHQSDDGTELVYMQARYYDPEIARFYSIDPVNFLIDRPPSFNRYAYANNNPYKYVDPDGRLPILVPLAIFLVKEAAAEVASHYTGGATDFLSVRRMATKGGKFALNKVSSAVSDGIEQQSKQLTKKASKGKTHKHHSHPIFMGGKKKQPLTTLAEQVHKDLHKDMNDFLKNRTDKFGNHMRPQRGNNGKKIRDNFSPQELLEALRDFYRGPGAKYKDAAADFFRQHPNL